MDLKQSCNLKKRKFCENQDLQSFSKKDLIDRIKQLESQVQQLKNVIYKKSSDKCKKKKSSKKLFDYNNCRKHHVVFKILYLGWNYDGFVQQVETTNTIEYHLFEALKAACLIENRETSNYSRCGRTDVGVSSFSQVISLTVRSRTNSEDICEELEYCKMLNANLPKDIRVYAWAPVSDDFNARFSCISRTYKYWFPRGDLDIQKMNEAAQYLIGEHDFRNLCKIDVANARINCVRRFDKIDVSVCSSTNGSLLEFDMCVVTLVAQSFLWHQIRCILSILFLIGKNKEAANIIPKLLNISTFNRKPQYAMADSLPLNLFSCEFENVNWVISESCISNVMSTLQSYWCDLRIKSFMIEEMMKNMLPEIRREFITEPYANLFKNLITRNYKPILSRPTSKSVEESIDHFVKKGKLEHVHVEPEISLKNKEVGLQETE